MQTSTVKPCVGGMLWLAASVAVAAPAALAASATAAPAQTAIVTGSESGTYYKMAQDLQRWVLPSLVVKASNGSWDNLNRLAQEPGVSFAMVQSDVLDFMKNRISTETDPQRRAHYQSLVGPLQVMAPLHEEELHVLVARDAKIQHLHQIKGLRIYMGRENSGSFITGYNLYRALFGEAPPSGEVQLDPTIFHKASAQEETQAALMSLGQVGKDQGLALPAVDVVMLVGGQPYKAIQDLEKSEKIASRYKFLSLDRQHPSTAQLKGHYGMREIHGAQHYPTVAQGQAVVPTLAVSAYLVTAAFQDAQRNQQVEQFATQYCRQFQALQKDEQSHAKWRQLGWQPGTGKPPQLLAGWRTVSPQVSARLSRCGVPATPCKFPHPTIPGACAPS